jgi:hypothetical protein
VDEQRLEQHFTSENVKKDIKFYKIKSAQRRSKIDEERSMMCITVKLAKRMQLSADLIVHQRVERATGRRSRRELRNARCIYARRVGLSAS